MKTGERMPEFEGIDQNGKIVTSKSLIGKNVVIFFYPKDQSLVCTAEACAFRDYYSDFLSMDCEVIGISPDDLESHRRFSKKYELPFPLLSDKEGILRTRFKVSGLLWGMLPGRVTFVFGKDGFLLHVYSSQLHGEKHIHEALNILHLRTVA